LEGWFKGEREAELPAIVLDLLIEYMEVRSAQAEAAWPAEH
jgi:hypothetical protein